MRLFQKVKDGGDKSTVDAYFLIELKGLFSIALLKFNKGSRENYHNHAFNALTFFLCGEAYEYKVNRPRWRYKRFRFKYTPRDNMHKVYAYSNSWAITFRGPWKDTWKEFNPMTLETTTLTHGRRIVDDT